MLSRSQRLTRLRVTALPSFLLTEKPTRVTPSGDFMACNTARRFLRTLPCRSHCWKSCARFIRSNGFTPPGDAAPSPADASAPAGLPAWTFYPKSRAPGGACGGSVDRCVSRRSPFLKTGSIIDHAGIERQAPHLHAARFSRTGKNNFAAFSVDNYVDNGPRVSHTVLSRSGKSPFS